MSRIFRKGFSLAVVVLIFFLTATMCEGQETEEIYVFAAASLTDAVQEIAEEVQARYSCRIFFNFAGSNTLRLQIERGSPADVYLSANRANAETLLAQGLTTAELSKIFLSNTLVVVFGASEARSLTDLGQLKAYSHEMLSLADPDTVPAGIYAKEALVNAGMWEELKESIVPALDVRAALAQVEQGNVPWGIVYKTDSHMTDKVRIAFEIPPENYSTIEYHACIIDPSEISSCAVIFWTFLGNDVSRQIFQKYGFLTDD